MPANFTSGWLGNGERAWHGKGVVTEGTLPAREAFETADALFTVEKRKLFFPYGETELPDGSEHSMWAPTDSFAVVRTDTQALLGVVSKQYEIVQNDSLLRIAEFIRERLTWTASSFYQMVPRSVYCYTPWCRDGHRPW